MEIYKYFEHYLRQHQVLALDLGPWDTNLVQISSGRVVQCSDAGPYKCDGCGLCLCLDTGGSVGAGPLLTFWKLKSDLLGILEFASSFYYRKPIIRPTSEH